MTATTDKRIPTSLMAALRPVTIVCGHYGTGKTNLTVNLALDLAAAGHKVTVIDLDIVNPYFRVSEQRELLEGQGVRLIALCPDGRRARLRHAARDQPPPQPHTGARGGRRESPRDRDGQPPARDSPHRQRASQEPDHARGAGRPGRVRPRGHAPHRPARRGQDVPAGAIAARFPYYWKH